MPGAGCHLRAADVLARGHRMPVERGQRDLVKVNEAQARDARPGQHVRGVRPDAADADDAHVRALDVRLAVPLEELLVARELLAEDEVALRPAVRRARPKPGATHLVRDGRLGLIQPHSMFKY